MMSDVHEAAMKSALSSVNIAERLPHFVFSRPAATYFCRSDVLLQPNFHEAMRLLREADTARACALVNLDHYGSTDTRLSSSYFFEQGGSYQDFMQFAQAGVPGYSWIASMSRYICASDIGGWVFYSESVEGIGVFGLFDHHGDPGKYTAAISELSAEPLPSMLSNPNAPSPFNELVDSWRQALLANYGV